MEPVRFKTDKSCVICGMALEFVEMEDVVYLICPRCKRGVYVERWRAAMYAQDMPFLIDHMAATYATLAQNRHRRG